MTTPIKTKQTLVEQSEDLLDKVNKLIEDFDSESLSPERARSKVSNLQLKRCSINTAISARKNQY